MSIYNPSCNSSTDKLSQFNSLPTLPQFNSVASPNFTWGDKDSASFCSALKDVYVEVVHWRKNCFKVPLGNVGKAFVEELSRLFNAFASASALESVALMATTVLPILVLQNPHHRSKVKEHITCLKRRLEAWIEGDLKSLVEEGRTIQHRLSKVNPRRADAPLARSFAKLMFKGKTHEALNLLSNNGRGQLLHLNQSVETNNSSELSVKEILVSKHPTGQPAALEALLPGTIPEIHPVIYECIDSQLIRSVALRTYGAAGPSGLNAYAWKRVCSVFKQASNSLCQSLANVAKRLCSSYIDPKVLSPLLACRLIALDKCPGVRPIGIDDTARRIIAKAVQKVTSSMLQGLSSCVRVKFLAVKQQFIQLERVLMMKTQRQLCL